MGKEIDWFFSIVRIAGASFPVASSFVQLQAEIDSKKIKERVTKLEDPVSFLHDDVPELSRKIYRKLKSKDSANLQFDEEFYKKYRRPLAVLEAQHYIEGSHAIGTLYAEGIVLVDPSYIMYLCALAEEDSKMEALIKMVDSCRVGKWLDGTRIRTSIDLPLPVIQAVFDIYESKGYGICSREIHSCQYMGQA